jgi:hypothetical protein
LSDWIDVVLILLARTRQLLDAREVPYCQDRASKLGLQPHDPLNSACGSWST